MWNQPEAIHILADEVSSIADIRRTAEAAGVPGSAQLASYSNARAAWADVLEKARAADDGRALQRIVRARWPELARTLDSADAAEQAEPGAPQHSYLPLIVAAAVIATVATARAAFAGFSGPVVGAGCGVLLAAGLVRANPQLGHRRLYVATLAFVLLGAAGGYAVAKIHLGSPSDRGRHGAGTTQRNRSAPTNPAPAGKEAGTATNR
jgi:hypothetical protein